MDPEQIMRQMMQGMPMPFMGPMFGGFGGPMHSRNGSHDPFSALVSHDMMSPMSMMMMNPFQGMQQAMSMAHNNPNGGVSYCSSSVTSYTTDQNGRTQVYQQSNEVKQGPDGLKETKSAVRDSRTGHQELSIGHHLRDKAHIKKKSKNVYTNEEEDCEDFVGIDESEVDTFEQNWQQKARSIASCPNNSYNQIQYNYPQSGRNNRLALTSSANEDQHAHKSSGISSFIDKVAMKTKKKKRTKEPKN